MLARLALLSASLQQQQQTPGRYNTQFELTQHDAKCRDRLLACNVHAQGLQTGTCKGRPKHATRHWWATHFALQDLHRLSSTAMAPLCRFTVARRAATSCLWPALAASAVAQRMSDHLACSQASCRAPVTAAVHSSSSNIRLSVRAYDNMHMCATECMLWCWQAAG